MKPTRVRELVAAAVVVGVLAYVFLTFTYRDLPRFPRTAPLSLFIVGLVEAQTASITRRRLQGRPGTRPILPLTVARLAALAKASSLAGAALVGAWAAVLGYVLPRLGEFGTAGTDAVTAALGVSAALVLLVSGLLLERVCRIPKS
ncbi:DUF3180 domain-containing protein [Candidatus Protofrankia californiensis]|uniref:DUF3180 domain-containing protein n=1 Tax=Candidatus Protofrankia californiensis TaxID=1839754 RepID=UPI00104103A7|nr:DUF3180 domain-containing protein [Candidatus Protofrankia californiensis]